MRLIDAEPILKRLFPLADKNEDVVKNPYEKAKINAYRRAFEEVYKAPIIEAEPIRHGHWVEVGNGFIGFTDKCSCCDGRVEHNKFKYAFCPNCGAKMDKESEEQ